MPSSSILGFCLLLISMSVDITKKARPVPGWVETPGVVYSFGGLAEQVGPAAQHGPVGASGRWLVGDRPNSIVQTMHYFHAAVLNTFDPFSSPSSQPDSAMAKSIVAMVVVVALAMTKMPTFSHPFANLDVRMLASLSRQGPQQKSFPSPSHSGRRLTASSMPWPQKSKSKGSRHSESSWWAKCPTLWRTRWTKWIRASWQMSRWETSTSILRIRQPVRKRRSVLRPWRRCGNSNGSPHQSLPPSALQMTARGSGVISNSFLHMSTSNKWWLSTLCTLWKKQEPKWNYLAWMSATVKTTCCYTSRGEKTALWERCIREMQSWTICQSVCGPKWPCTWTTKYLFAKQRCCKTCRDSAAQFQDALDTKASTMSNFKTSARPMDTENCKNMA